MKSATAQGWEAAQAKEFCLPPEHLSPSQREWWLDGFAQKELDRERKEQAKRITENVLNKISKRKVE